MSDRDTLIFSGDDEVLREYSVEDMLDEFYQSEIEKENPYEYERRCSECNREGDCSVCGGREE